MIVISDKLDMSLAFEIAQKLSVNYHTVFINEYSNSEVCIDNVQNLTVSSDVVVIVSSIYGDVNKSLLKLLFLINFVKKSVSKYVVCIIPYFGYSRHDNDFNEFKVVLDIIKQNCDKIITLDLHNTTYCDDKLINISSFEMWNNQLYLEDDDVVVFPDSGCVSRQQTNIFNNIAFFEKNKNLLNNKIEILHKYGTVCNKNCCIIDDIIDSGETILSVSKKLLDLNAKSVYWRVTHFISENKESVIKKSLDLGIKSFYTFDTVKHDVVSPNLKIISCADIIAKKC